MSIVAPPAAVGRTEVRVGSRFVAALAVSGLIHAAFIGAASEPGTRRARTSTGAESFALTARLVPVEPRSLPQALPEARIEAPARVRAAPVKQAPSPRASTVRPATAEERKDESRVSQAPDTVYYGARQLDRYPELITALDLRFPADADPAVSAGHVLLLVLIDAQGRVNDASVVEAAPPGVFDEAATRALQSARFKPAVKDGRAVRSRLVVHVTYGKPE